MTIEMTLTLTPVSSTLPEIKLGLPDAFLLTSQSSAQQAIYLLSVVDVNIACPTIDEQTMIVAHIETECSRLDSIIEKFKSRLNSSKSTGPP